MAAVAAERRPAYVPAVLAGILAFCALAALTALPLGVVVPGVALIVAIVASARAIFQWRGLVSLTILVIMFVPMRRYALPGNMPFELELYRLVVGIVAMFWCTSLLIDP